MTANAPVKVDYRVLCLIGRKVAPDVRKTSSIAPCHRVTIHEDDKFSSGNRSPSFSIMTSSREDSYKKLSFIMQNVGETSNENDKRSPYWTPLLIFRSQQDVAFCRQDKRLAPDLD